MHVQFNHRLDIQRNQMMHRRISKLTGTKQPVIFDKHLIFSDNYSRTLLAEVICISVSLHV